ncbi:hypothetical protein [Desulfocicer niacini]
MKQIDQLPEKLTIAFSPDLGYAKVQRDVMACVEEAVKAFEQIGHTVDLWTVSLPYTGDTWTSLICTDIYAQLCDVLKTDRQHMGRTLMTVVENTRDFTI